MKQGGECTAVFFVLGVGVGVVFQGFFRSLVVIEVTVKCSGLI